MKYAYQEAIQAWYREPPSVSWEAMVNHHLESDGAWILKGPEFFIAARRVGVDWSDEEVTGCEKCDPAGKMLHVSVVTGDLCELLAQIPDDLREELEWMSFQRSGYRLHKWSFARLMAASGM